MCVWVKAQLPYDIFTVERICSDLVNPTPLAGKV